MKNFILAGLTCLMTSGVFAAQTVTIKAKGSVRAKLNYLGIRPKSMGSDCGAIALITLGGAYGIKKACWEPEEKTTTVSVSGRILVAPWGEGKATINLTVEGTKGCSGFQGSFTGIQMASGGYDLYNIDNEVISVGKVINSGNSVVLIMKNGISATTSGQKGHNCTWSVSPDTVLEFSH